MYKRPKRQVVAACCWGSPRNHWKTSSQARFLFCDSRQIQSLRIRKVSQVRIRQGVYKKASFMRYKTNLKYGDSHHVYRLRGTSNQKQLLSESPTPLPRNYHIRVNIEDKHAVLDRLRTLSNKGALFGTIDWVSMMVDTYGMEETMRSSGRPAGRRTKSDKNGDCPHIRADECRVWFSTEHT